MRFRFRLAVLVGALVLMGAPAHAAQLDAADPPDISGGLSTPAKSCERQVTRRGGETAAVAKSCWFFYFVSEGDVQRDYAVVWLQSTVYGRHGWCTTRARSDLNINPMEGNYEANAPVRALSARRSVLKTTRLTADADEQTTDPGVLSQTYWMRKGNIKPSITTTEENSRFRTKWSGRAGRKVAVVSGAEVSYSALPTPELFTFSTMLTFTIEDC
jgi:hypothetical protein